MSFLMVRRRACAVSNHETAIELRPSTDLVLRSLPPGPCEARPDDKLRKRREGWTQAMDSRPSFETRAKGALLQRRRRSRCAGMRSEIYLTTLSERSTNAGVYWIAPRQGHCIAATLMPVGPRMTTNNTGRKNRIIGTVSFGGSAAAFFSASFMRMSRFSCAMTRRLWPSGVP